MGKRYYCEFCDKSFPDNLENRKKHNEGAQHQRLRIAYYNQYKDIETILCDEREKPQQCKKFFSSGHCAFGELCRNSHRTARELERLNDLYTIERHEKLKEEEIELEKKKLRHRTYFGSKKRFQTNKDLTDFLTREEEENLLNFMPKYTLPKTLQAYNQNFKLPVSCLPPNYKDFLNTDFNFNSWSFS